MSNNLNGGNLESLLCNYIGETVTIFTKSGGQSGSGFTGVILSVNDCFVRLITRIGPAPGCALGNACNGIGNFGGSCGGDTGFFGSNFGGGAGCGGSGFGGGGKGKSAGGFDGFPVFSVGSVTDIPLDSIASFVHNAV